MQTPQILIPAAILAINRTQSKEDVMLQIAEAYRSDLPPALAIPKLRRQKGFYIDELREAILMNNNGIIKTEFDLKFRQRLFGDF